MTSVMLYHGDVTYRSMDFSIRPGPRLAINSFNECQAPSFSPFQLAESEVTWQAKLDLHHFTSSGLGRVRVRVRYSSDES